MKAPAFWWRQAGWEAALLAPAAALVDATTRRRLARPGIRARIPVVCIGNVTAGGAGKTPTAIATARLLGGLRRSPAFLTRGYGGRLAGPVLVDPERHDAGMVGDEALLLTRIAPTIVSRDRPAGGELAATLGADVIVMDDGLQNPALAKTLAVAVFDGRRGIGNARVLPAGPLRASMEAHWGLIDAVVIVGDGAAGEAIATEARERGRPAFRGTLRPQPDALSVSAPARALAFAGIGDPDKFFRTCRECGIEVAETAAFGDHHAYSAREVSRLLDRAERLGLVPLTTEKDLVRLDTLREREPRIAFIRALPVELVFADEARWIELLTRRLVEAG